MKIKNIGFAILLAAACTTKKTSVSNNSEMIALLSQKDSSDRANLNNPFYYQAKLNFCDSMLNTSIDSNKRVDMLLLKAQAYLEKGEEASSIAICKEAITKINQFDDIRRTQILKTVALSYLRSGERDNCVLNHGNQSCIFPITLNGIHKDKTGSTEAINIYKILLKHYPNDLELRWLLNIAYMTVGQYPKDVPPSFLLKGLNLPSEIEVKPFNDISSNVGLNIKNQSGGSIIDDFNNDGYLDVITSSWDLKEGMHYMQATQDGKFIDLSKESGLNQITGGLNITTTDYNNDGFKDVFVLRGAWKGALGNDPNSLLKNNGDGTFTDVTKISGLLSFHPTQTATWSDFNNDGWLDVFIGNETQPKSFNPCEMFINNKNGTFTEVAAEAGCQIAAFVKGVSSGDYNNDGLSDIFISTLDGSKILLKNMSIAKGKLKFVDVSEQARLNKNKAGTFGTWFWDYNNDGWLDILTCGYNFSKSLATYAAADALNIPVPNTGQLFLFQNMHNGTFQDVSKKAGFNKVAFAMGCNYGDIDNDGFLDFYLGTGNPKYESLVPNKLYKNVEGNRFVDITTSARVGNLQKGHGVSFADLDNDGDQDIYIDMGGAYVGDSYSNSFYQNPGQNNNAWLDINLKGVKANRVAIGARIKVTFLDKGKERSVFRDVNTGASFGNNPLRQHIGIGGATIVKSIKIIWPGSNAVQNFNNVAINQLINIQEGQSQYTVTRLKKIKYDLLSQKAPLCD